MLSFDFGESSRDGSENPSSFKLSLPRVSGDGGAPAGNLNPCGNDEEPCLRMKGAAPRPGVLGAVTIPDCLREGRSGTVLFEPKAEWEEIRGEGWVEDRCPTGAVVSQYKSLPTNRLGIPEVGDPEKPFFLGTTCKLADRP